MFFTSGGDPFLTKMAVVGDHETFYMCCLRWYIPTIAQKTFSDTHLGVVEFITQDYERRNKEIKSLLPSQQWKG